MFQRLILVPLILFLVSGGASAWAPTHRVDTEAASLLLRVVDDRTLLFRFQPVGSEVPLEPSPIWAPEAPFHRTHGADSVETLLLGEPYALVRGGGDPVATLTVRDDPSGGLSLEVQETQGDTVQRYRLVFEGPVAGGGERFRLSAPHIDELYGLGEQFPPELLGQTDGDLLGHVRYSGAYLEAVDRDPKGVYGNAMVGLDGGAVGNALFPVLFLVDAQGPDALLALDHPGDARWDFRNSPWTVDLRRPGTAGVLAWGEPSARLRPKLMGWLGRSPVPPRKAFGLWISEYGYESWDEVREKVEGLRAHGFPLDGFVLDLQWFGGIEEGSAASQMGSLTFDEQAFPKPKETLAEFAQEGLGAIVIEEAYIAGDLPEYGELAEAGFLVRSPDSDEPHWIDENPWWGLGSMLDFTNPEAADRWHRWKRQPLRELGIIGHWTDLGEPEMFRSIASESGAPEQYKTPIYHGDQDQLAANNLFAFRWAESIFRGFASAADPAERPRTFILTRTGTAGIGRFGAALWSGDIGSTWESLRSHYRAQSHLAMSGLDYFGSDVGGFHRAAFKGDEAAFDELYTRWFGAACLTDLPLRPHTMNLSGSFETTPDRVGDRASNLRALKRRYQLIPYLYSAAHLAWRQGQTVVAPLVLEEPEDRALARAGDHKLIGADLLTRLVLEPGVSSVATRLPGGRWYDFDTGAQLYDGPGGTVKLPSVVDGELVTPLLARGGAIVPLGSPESSETGWDRLELRIFPGSTGARGRLFQDDGWSDAYQEEGEEGEGAVAETRFELRTPDSQESELTIGARRGPGPEGVGPREVVLEVASEAPSLLAEVGERQVRGVRRDGFWRFELGRHPSTEPLKVRLKS